MRSQLRPEEAIARARLPGNPPVLVACSGGPDSVALVHLLAEAGAGVVALAHVDHGLRPGSADEAQVVAEHGAALGLPVRCLRVSVQRRGSLEDAARQARWEALRSAVTGAGASLIATGHTADDQAETVLMRLARGAGTTGVAAMRPLASGVWRPLLGVRRSALRELCSERGWRVVRDPTNENRTIERNRVRLDVLPLLGARAVPALARAARLAADDEDLLESLAAQAPIESRADGNQAIALSWLESAHPALGRRAIRRMARQTGAPQPLPAARIEEVRAGGAVSLGGGLSSWREGGLVVVGRRPDRARH